MKTSIVLFSTLLAGVQSFGTLIEVVNRNRKRKSDVDVFHQNIILITVVGDNDNDDIR